MCLLIICIDIHTYVRTYVYIYIVDVLTKGRKEYRFVVSMVSLSW